MRRSRQKYLCDGLDTESNKSRPSKLEQAYHLTKNTYNKKNTSNNTKISH